jgi:ABC-type uncharacterized transport system permease subunit
MKYLRYYIRLETARLAYDFSKTYNLLVAIVGSLCFFLLHLSGFYFIISKFSFPNWPTSHSWMLFSTFELFTYLCFHFFWRGLLYSKTEISQGVFDYHLLKPANTRFLAFMREGSFNNSMCVYASLGLLIYSLIHFRIEVSPLTVFLYTIFFIISLWQFHLLSSAFMTSNIFFGTMDSSPSFAFKFQEIWKYPPESYLSNPLATIFFFPVSLATSLPTIFLLNRHVEPKYIMVYFAWTLLLYFLNHYLWKLALRRYSSASS